MPKPLSPILNPTAAAVADTHSAAAPCTPAVQTHPAAPLAAQTLVVRPVPESPVGIQEVVRHSRPYWAVAAREGLPEVVGAGDHAVAAVDVGSRIFAAVVVVEGDRCCGHSCVEEEDIVGGVMGRAYHRRCCKRTGFAEVVVVDTHILLREGRRRSCSWEEAVVREQEAQLHSSRQADTHSRHPFRPGL